MTREELIEVLVETLSTRSREELMKGLPAGAANRLIVKHPKVMRSMAQNTSALSSRRINRHDWKRIVKRAKEVTETVSTRKPDMIAMKRHELEARFRKSFRGKRQSRRDDMVRDMAVMKHKRIRQSRRTATDRFGPANKYQA